MIDSRTRYTDHPATIAVVTLAVALALASTGCAGGERSEGERSAHVDSLSGGGHNKEMTQYEGIPLNTFYRGYDNSIKGPQSVDLETYRLTIGGLVEHPQSLKYEEVLDHEWQTRLLTLFCVEGWQERLVFEGVRVADLLAPAAPKPGVKTIVFRAADGYSTSLPYEDVDRLDLMLAAKINGLQLDEMRGMPFQLVADTKQGYKWIKWVTSIELSDEPFSGFWESRGYSNVADVQKSRIERERRLIEERQPSSPTPD